MWRDPLEELIEDLDRVAPDPQAAAGGLMPIEQLQRYTDIILYGTDAEVEALNADSAYRAWLTQWAEACGRGRGK